MRIERRASLYPEMEPYDRGLMDVGEGNLVYWETCGNPQGKPALVVHGGPGSGCTPWHRRLFDPDAYCIALFDQRNCGRSRPHAGDPNIDLTTNTTHHLIDDMELLRESLHVDQWLVLGGSWGSTLALAYAQAYPQRVTQVILWGVTTGRRREFDWLFRGGVAVFFPEQWERLRNALPATDRDSDIVEAYHRLLHDRDSVVRERAALAWCMWESATPAWPPGTGIADRFLDPAYALAFARLVTHYVRHDAWLEDGALPHGVGALADIPAILINGRFDFQAPVAWAWGLHRAWPRSELVIVDDAGHDPGHSGVTRALVRATDRLSRR
jgi:proline iminopeptidase